MTEPRTSRASYSLFRRVASLLTGALPKALVSASVSLVFVLPLATQMVLGDPNYGSVDPVAEVRAVWLNASSIPKTSKEIRALVAAYRRANINVIFPEVVCRGYAVYPSRLLARDPRFAGASDILADLIKEAHKRGLEVHAWVWVFRGGYAKDRGAILNAHPDWTEQGADGRDLSPNGGFWISPANSQACEYLASVFRELVTSYDIDGVHLDYVRYEDESKIPFGYSECSKKLFEKQYGIEPPDSTSSPDDIHVYEWRKFRERMVNAFVHRIALQTRSLKPRVKISAAVVPDPILARRKYMQNWLHWIDNKWLDFVVPMAYDSDDEHFGRVIANLKSTVNGKSIIVAGIGSNTLKADNQFIRQVAVSRKTGAHGQALFAAAYLCDVHLEALQAIPYKAPAMLPFRNPRRVAEEILHKAAEQVSKVDLWYADYLTQRARDLISYIGYIESSTGYVRPTPPP
jgi:uncharacterized lipoprotein YddW (UPF0748 family)